MDKILRKHNFWTAFQMMAFKLGYERDYHRLMRGHDPDAVKDGEKDEFIKKITHILAINYDVHHCPPPATCEALRAGTPVKFPTKYPRG